MSDQDKPVPSAGRTVVRKRRCNRWNAKRKQTFLAMLAETANVQQSAAKAKMSLAAAYLLKHRDPAFARAWLEALEVGYSEVEMRMLRESIKGTERVEILEKGKARELEYVKTVRSFPFSVAVRLFIAHRDEVLAFRRERDGIEEPQESATDRARAFLEEVDALLAAHESGETDGPEPAGA